VCSYSHGSGRISALLLSKQSGSKRTPGPGLLAKLDLAKTVLVRIHSECFTGDVLGSLRCDCGPQLNQAMQQVAQAGAGIIIYLRQEGRGIGLLDKLRAYNLMDEGYDTVDANLKLGHQADARDYTIAVRMLQDLGVTAVQAADQQSRQD
jgi:GTP cyclohydrolase II